MNYLAIIGFFISGLGLLVVTVKAFKTSVAWGLGCLLVPPVIFPYMLVHPKESVKPFLLISFGMALIVLSGSSS
ncbi:hypothetical protein [Marinobacter sp. CA1]|uniref:hypothetical protein n=1 Tax=Marinobacter sp. CA1 TaxID=2817656 RepID=UPI001D091680|nr:hypothetical protein [Marinobacter sp. CA1]UDL06947.1 hypothetical protein J2887_09470 [Marinobacter sp. CA1]